MSRQPWMKWFPSDWRGDPKVRACDPIARYVWMEMLGLMHDADPFGHLVLNGKPIDPKTLARVIGVEHEQVKMALRQLRDAGVFSETDDGIIFSRRMVRDENRSKTLRENGKKGGNPHLKKQDVTGGKDNQTPNQADKPHIPEAIFQKPEPPNPRSATTPDDPGARRLADFRKGIVQAFQAAGSMTLNPDTHRAAVWIEQGYDPALCLAVIREGLARRPNIRSVSYFDDSIREAHEKRKQPPAEAAPDEPRHDFGCGVVWPHSTIRRAVDRYLSDPSPQRHWPTILGPPPGEPGCRVPPQLLPAMKGEADGQRPHS